MEGFYEKEIIKSGTWYNDGAFHISRLWIKGWWFGKAVNTKPEEQGKVLNIYCWNDEFKSRFEGYYKNVPSDVKVNWVITPNENNAYQNALDTLHY